MRTSFKRVFAVAGIGLGLMIGGMMWSIVNTALASIQKDLSATVLELQWMMNCFGIFICVPLLTMGKLGDAYGRRGLYICGLVIMLVGSAFAGFSSHMGLLIASMGLIGLSASITLPLSQALLVHQFPESEKEKAVNLWSIFASLALAIGPLIGGFILNFWSWRWVYLINIPIILIVIPILLIFVDKEEERHKPHCDWGGVGLLALIVGSLILAIMQGPSWGWCSPIILGLFTLTLVSLIVFIILERKSSAPIFRPDLFSNRAFLFSAIPNGCMIGFIWVAFFLIPIYLQNLKNFTPFETGLTLLLVTLPVALLSTPVTACYRRVGAKPLLLIGFSFLILSALLQTAFVPKGAFWPVALGCFFLGMGWVLIWNPSISSALSSLPHKIAGTASGMFVTVQEFGAVVSLSIAGVFYRETQETLLTPHMSQIDSSLQNFSADQVQSFLSNPSAVEKTLGSSSPVVTWLQEAFLGSYQVSFCFLIGLSLFAIFMTLFLPKKTLSKARGRVKDK